MHKSRLWYHHRQALKEFESCLLIFKSIIRGKPYDDYKVKDDQEVKAVNNDDDISKISKQIQYEQQHRDNIHCS